MDKFAEKEHVSPEVFGSLDMPHDRLPFDELAKRYNFRQTTDWKATFARLLLEECERAPRPVRALDIGCGHGIGRKPQWTAEIRGAVDELWGIEPDENQKPREGLFDHFQHALMETAECQTGIALSRDGQVARSP